MIQKFNNIKSLCGELSLTGDKSISHRVLIFSAMANGKSYIRNLSEALDVMSTLNCLRQLGAEFTFINNTLIVNGVGEKGFKPPDSSLNCYNSGTTARLLAGLLIAQKFNCTLTGDESLSKRPMKRVIVPLELMGGKIRASGNNTLPVQISASEKICKVDYQLNIPSAQVKSAVLIAGLHIDDETSVTESSITRDHTERLLGLKVERIGEKIRSKSSRIFYPLANEYYVPGDISSASFLIVAALMTKNSEIKIRNVSLNPTRTLFIDLLKKMGARIDIIKLENQNNEVYGDLLISSSKLTNVQIDEEIISSIIDEIPILAIAGVFANGKFEIRNCKELRVKESDRIKSICYNLVKAGLNTEEYDDGFSFEGELSNHEISFESFGDHRIAMAFAILSMLNKNGGTVNEFECVNVSNPLFINQINSVCKSS